LFLFLIEHISLTKQQFSSSSARAHSFVQIFVSCFGQSPRVRLFLSSAIATPHRRRLSDKCFSDLGDDSSSASTTAPSSPTSHRPCLLLGVRRIDYFRYDTETMTWTEDPGFDYLLDIVDFRHIRSAPATTFVPIL
jgi:hypothetical protein